MVKLNLAEIPEDVESLLNQIQSENNTENAFIRVSKLEKVIKVMKKISQKARTAEEVSEILGLTRRISVHYINACIYLGTVVEKKDEKNERCYYPTKLGREVSALKYSDRSLALKIFELMCKNQIFHILFKETFENKQLPDLDRIYEVMKELDVCRATLRYDQKTEMLTLDRRAQSVRQWIFTILNALINDRRLTEERKPVKKILLKGEI